MNGIERKRATSYRSHSAISAGYSNLNFGAGGPLSFANDDWNLQIDDFAYFDQALTADQVSFVHTKGESYTRIF